MGDLIGEAEHTNIPMPAGNRGGTGIMGSHVRASWPAAFAAYCCGAPPEEIAEVHNIPLSFVKSHITREGWDTLRAALPLGVTEHPSTSKSVGKKLAKIEKNRAENLEIWVKLRDDLLDIIDQLRAGKLTVERQWHNKGAVTRADVELTIADRYNLANYARVVADGTYRALGDLASQEKPGQDAAGGAANTPAITIILPGAVSMPRNERMVEGQVIDLTGSEAQAISATSPAMKISLPEAAAGTPIPARQRGQPVAVNHPAESAEPERASLGEAAFSAMMALNEMEQ